MKPQPLTDTFVEAVRYIYYNRRRLERVEIDKHLLSLDFDPGEIDRAWQAIEAKQGWAILQEARKPLAIRKFPGNIPYNSPSTTIFFRFISLILIFIISLFSWGFATVGRDMNYALLLLISFSGAIFNCLLFIFFWFNFAKKWKIGWISGLLIIAQIFIITNLVSETLGKPAAPSPFAPYPNATKLVFSRPDPLTGASPEIIIHCNEAYLDSPMAIYATTNELSAIQDFYDQQAYTIGRNGLERTEADARVSEIRAIANSYSSTVDGAFCYIGKVSRNYIPTNAVIILSVTAHKDTLPKIFPYIPADTTYIIVVFNGVTDRGYI